ncbi:MAG: DMT family transporter [Actinomycetes bacterium]
MTWLLLVIAIALEVTGTLTLRASDGFSRLWPSLLTIACYGGAFGLLSQVLRQGMPVGIAYGVWAASGVALVALLGWLVFDERLSVLSTVGIGVVIAGVLLVELGSRHPIA